MLNKKWILGLGGVLAVAAPIATVISCSSTSGNHSKAPNKPTKQNEFTWNFRGKDYTKANGYLSPAEILQTIWGHNATGVKGSKLVKGDKFIVKIKNVETNFSYTLTKDDAINWNTLDTIRQEEKASVHKFVKNFFDQIGEWTLTKANGGDKYIQKYNEQVQKIVDALPPFHG